MSLATYRRSGDPVPTPVWVVRDGDDLLVWTGAASGKVTRLRRDPRVELAPCSRRGQVAPDARRLAGRADVTTDPEALRRVERLLAAKYGLQFRAVSFVERLVPRMRRQGRAVLRISDA